MRCPIDGTELQIAARSGIEIDYCPQCKGVWLDRGELDKLIARESELAPETYDDFDRDASVVTGKAKNDQRLPHREERRPAREYDADDDYDERRYDERGGKRRRRSFLEDIFDIFD